MAFFFADEPAPDRRGPQAHRQTISIETMHSLKCKVCPRDKDRGVRTPKMEEEGTSNPYIYVLTGTPTQEADDEGHLWTDKWHSHFVRTIGEDFARKYMRFAPVTRCFSASPRDYEVQRTCCQPFRVEDIERTRPEVVVAVDGEALTWATGLVNIQGWRGKFIPARIGSHECWVYPIMSPGFVLKGRGKYRSKFEVVFDFDLLNLRKRFESNDLGPPPKLATPDDYYQGVECIDGTHGEMDLLALDAAFEELRSNRTNALDLETNGLRPYMPEPKIWTISIGTFGKSFVLPIDHPLGWRNEYERRAARNMVMDFIAEGHTPLIAHNTKFEHEWLGAYFSQNILRRGEWHDTLLMSYELDEKPGIHSLGVQTQAEFGFNVKSLTPDIRPEDPYCVPYDKYLMYNGLDTKWEHGLFTRFKKKLLDDPQLWDNYRARMRMIPTLVRAQLRGVLPDFDEADRLGASLDDAIAEAEAKLARTKEVREYERRFGKFEPGNSDHVVILLRDVLEREEAKRVDNDSGKVSWSGDEEVLSSLPVSKVPSAPLILDHRRNSKLKSTYVGPVQIWRTKPAESLVKLDGLIHTSYNPADTTTGRLASDDPNLQNWPKRKRKDIRKIIRARINRIMASFDYGQIEARVIAMASRDRNLVKYLWQGYDIHGAWAKIFTEEEPKIFDRIARDYETARDDEKVLLKKFRDEIKNGWVFPLFFGSSPKSCSRNLQVDEELCFSLAERFWDEFGGVLKWQEKTMKQWERNLYVESLTGRRRRGALTKNEIINLPIQGTAMDIVAEAMNVLSEMSEAEDDDDLQAEMQIHDDLTFELWEATADKKIPLIGMEMCRPRFDFINVPIIVEASKGYNWYEQKEVAVYRSNVIFGDEYGRAPAN